MNSSAGVADVIRLPVANFPFSIVTKYAPKTGDLDGLYEKAKVQQWNASTAIDWSHELDPENPLKMPDGMLLIYDTDLWRKMTEKERANLRNHVQSWQISQLLHGEQASLMCAAKIVQGEADIGVKYAAAAQVFDEARHMEVYARLLTEKMVHLYPMSPSLSTLLGQILSESRVDFVCLGMQILVEGLALAFFKSVQAYSGDPFIRKLQSLILADEARHFALGHRTLQPLYEQMGVAERREREEFVAEACQLLHEHLCGDDVWEPLGLSRKDCAELVRASPVAASVRRTLFRQLVPAINGIGLMGSRLIWLFMALDVIDYAKYPV